MASDVGQRDAWQLTLDYALRIRQFRRADWIGYAGWIGSLWALLLGVSAFLSIGLWQGVIFPGYVYFIPGGTFIFAVALAFDDIGHRTVYKAELSRGEGYVHKMIAATAIPSVMCLCLCYQHPETFEFVALSFIALSLFYSAVDEAMHWVRYYKQGLDKIEMWSHFFAIFGHVTMITAWWQWFKAGYPGVKETLLALNGL